MRSKIWKYQVESITEEEAREINQEALAYMWKLIREGAVDLHTHSNASDGKSSPAQLVQKVMENHLKAFALSDHDTVKGIEIVSMVYEKLFQLQIDLADFIPAVEISASYEGQEIHLLAYYPVGNIRLLEAYLETRCKAREERNKQLCQKMQEQGIAIQYEELQNEGGNVIGRLHVAQLLIRKGYVTSVDEAFDLYLAEGRPAYVKRDLPLAKDVIQNILQTGGVPVLAHPAIYKGWLRGEEAKGEAWLEEVLRTLQEDGLQGVEVLHGQTSLEESEIIARVAGKRKLLPTVGSDYHGSHKPDVYLRNGEDSYDAFFRTHYGEAYLA